MTPLRLFSPTGFVEIHGEVQLDAALPGMGDARLTARAQAGGYAGQASAWVTREQLMRFRDALAALHRSQTGEEASLASMSPGQLRLRIMPLPSRSLLAVQCSLGRPVNTGSARFWQAAALSLEFDGAQLETALNAAWLQPAVAASHLD